VKPCPTGRLATGVQPFELAANCTVCEGETTFVDVSDVAAGSIAFEGRLSLDGRPGSGWAARLGPAGRLDFEGGNWKQLDPDGRFVLRAPEPAEYLLTLHLQGGEHQEQFLFDELDLEGGDAPWERDLHTGKLHLDGMGPWQGDGPPPVVHVWKGLGRMLVITVPVGNAATSSTIEVPAGPGELRSPSESLDPDTWKVLRKLDIPRGGELRVELGPEEMSGR
jgi:hypothetical protein